MNIKGGKRESERRGKDRGSRKSKEGRRWNENQRLKSSEDTTARDRGIEERKGRKRGRKWEKGDPSTVTRKRKGG